MEPGRNQLFVVILLTSACLVYCSQYVTVFYGIPAWKNASIPLFCATKNRDTWGTIQCLPDNDDYQEIILNVTEAFDAWNNTVTEQAVEDVWHLFETSIKPCVKLTPLCVAMNCSRVQGNTTTPNPRTSSSTTSRPPTSAASIINETSNCIENNTCAGLGYEEMMQCEFNMKGLEQDKKRRYKDTWYLEDVVCDNTTAGTCYMRHCNTSIIKESCDKHYWDAMRFRYCAPPGFALLRCNDTNYSGFEPKCTKVVAASCTRMMETQTSTWFGFNGTRAENRTYIYWHGRDNRTIISLNKYYNLTMRCKRPGNKTVLPITLMSGLVFHSQPINTRPRQAWCRFGGRWREAMQEVKQTLVQHPRYKGINDTGKINFTKPGAGSDPEVAFMWTNCRGEFLYCNMTWFLNWVEDKNQTRRNYCHIKQIINTWHKVGKNVYLPPREGELACESTVTSIIANIDIDKNRTHTNITFSAEVAELYRLELGDYKLIEITPIGFAPTDQRRYSSTPVRNKRGVFVLGFLGFLATAGSAMGARSLTLSAQSRTLLAGIVQQQQQLLDVVKRQQEMLRLTVWGTKNLQARVTAIEKYLKHQAQLNSWGCAFRQVCHTTVPWVNDSLSPDWKNMTWQEWEKQVRYLEANISQSLEEAQIQQEKNMYELQKLNSWDILGNWFDLTSWVKYIQYGVHIVVGIIALRIAIYVVQLLSRFRKGYRPVFSSPPGYLQQIHIHKDRGQPANEGTEEDVGGDSGYDLWPWPINYVQFLIHLLTRLLIGLYNICRDLLSKNSPTRRLISQSLTAIRDWLRLKAAQLQYGCEWIQEAFQAFARTTRETLAGAWGWLWEAARRIGRGILAVPRRIRQGAELALL
ncbi:env polyprotein [Human immunodeficiency virus 2]|uniref:Envelope glycoprotein gp160 n=2 Tax=Human immunodeficiency virus 2 TaxID=11709 RepID=ENV_HV2BE|nr:env polyprotein [Human immunodeficiency virus 2]P18094.1 RecName: Full=Envelope glycoprotein gp160; AltName: Full=Env polyprotein; Contains: RecName: Full=Surface protein gp120; Short=SU; AltName: Full=Glycoprotein 120; Short=gp120; Contains: RecName: Full=Transmembrane protein gp41; Short=TM; AltName: Full=Glycoprotein 41; Short=gp41; Flags: Precursor [Human immunodeficiency virus type 2 (ISOLATE BEN)]AAB00743.1 env polyprotein [Human immunodeficiency virus 2]QLK12533.1 envelope glycoprotein